MRQAEWLISLPNELEKRNKLAMKSSVHPHQVVGSDTEVNPWLEAPRLSNDISVDQWKEGSGVIISDKVNPS